MQVKFHIIIFLSYLIDYFVLIFIFFFLLLGSFLCLWIRFAFLRWFLFLRLLLFNRLEEYLVSFKLRLIVLEIAYYAVCATLHRETAGAFSNSIIE